MLSNTEKGNSRFFLDNRYELCITELTDDIVTFCLDFIPEDLTELFSYCDVIDYNDDFSELYETIYEDFCNIVKTLAETQRLSYPKRQ